MKYGIKVPYKLGHDYNWLMNNEITTESVPLLFDTKQEADKYVLEILQGFARVEEYDENQNSI